MKYFPQKFHGNQVTPKYSPQGFTPTTVIPIGDLLLDQFPGARAAYALRELNSNYFGACIRVKRTSNGEEQDIGFVNNRLDLQDLIDFVGASDGLVSIFYDQSGNNIHLDGQTNDSLMPKIIISGILQMSAGIESIFFDGINDVLYSNLNLPTPAGQLFVFCVCEKTNAASDGVLFNLDSPNTGNSQRCLTHAPFNNGRIFWDPGSVTTDRISTGTQFNDLIQHEITFTKISGSLAQLIKVDKNIQGQRTQGSTSTILSTIALGGGDHTAPAGPFEGQFQELVIYNTNVQSSVGLIEDDIIEYWSSNKVVTEIGEPVVTDTLERVVFV